MMVWRCSLGHVWRGENENVADDDKRNKDVIASDSSSDDSKDDKVNEFFGKVDAFVGHVDEDKIRRYIDLANLDTNDYLMQGPAILREWVTKLVKA